jgi:S-adenosylmethionine hydrolase
VDITHEISDFSISDAAFILNSFFSYFPSGTVHLTVVDPGVGGHRRALVVQTDKYFFVSPDNGILSYILESQKVLKVVEIKNSRYWHHPVSSTFHARDIFGPVAAHLSRGVALRDIGPSVKNPVRLNLPKPILHRDYIEGEVIYIDRYGNLITNIPKEFLDKKDLKKVRVRLGKRRLEFSDHYAQVRKGQIAVLFQSFGLLEIAAREENAEQKLAVCKGTRVRLEFV